MKKILFISYDGMTDPLGQSQVIPYLRGLSQKGYDISILSFEKKEKFKKLGEFIRTKLNAAGIHWHPLRFHSRPPIFSKWWDIQLMKTKARTLHRKEKFDLFHCRSYIAADVGLGLKRKTGVKLLFDMRGFWADEKAEGGSWNKNHFFWKRVYQYYKKKERQLITQADHIVTLTNAAKKEIEKWGYYDPRVPITVIPCCADAELFSITDDRQKRESRERTGLPQESFILSYLGSVGSWYMLDDMLVFFRQLLQKKANALFFFVTNSDPLSIKSRLADHDLDEKNVRIVQVDYYNVPLYMKASDVSISFIKPVYSKTASSPTKIGETLCMGIPLILNEIGDCGDILRACNAGFVVTEFTPSCYDNVIAGIDGLKHIERKQIRSDALHYYGLEQGVRKYVKVYKAALRIDEGGINNGCASLS